MVEFYPQSFCQTQILGNSFQQFIVLLGWLCRKFTHSSNRISNIGLTSDICIHHFTKKSTATKSLFDFEIVSSSNAFIGSRIQSLDKCQGEEKDGSYQVSSSLYLKRAHEAYNQCSSHTISLYACCFDQYQHH